MSSNTYVISDNIRIREWNCITALKKSYNYVYIKGPPPPSSATGCCHKTFYKNNTI